MSYTTDAATQLNLLSPTEQFLFTLRVIHAASADHLFVIDNCELEASGKVYGPIGAQLTLPQAEQGQAPTAQLSISNIRGLSEVIESTYGLRGGHIEIQQRFRERPVQIESSLLLEIKTCTMTNQAVQFGLGFASILDLPAIGASYRRASSKGLF